MIMHTNEFLPAKLMGRKMFRFGLTGLSYLIHAHLTAHFIPISENICCLLCKTFNFTFYIKNRVNLHSRKLDRSNSFLDRSN